MTDWADEKAREWWHEWGEKYADVWDDDSAAEELRKEGDSEKYNAEAEASLAALLREVALMGPSHDVKTLETMAKAEQAKAAVMAKTVKHDTLAEVRRVVEEETTKRLHITSARVVCDEILSRLDKL